MNFCEECGKEISARKTHCDDCKKKLRLEHRREDARELKKLKKANKKYLSNPIHAIMQELKEYNEAHGTNLSYGQYVAMKGDEA